MFCVSARLWFAVRIVFDVVATCVSPTRGSIPTLDDVCGQILPGADLLTMFSEFHSLCTALFTLWLVAVASFIDEI